MNRVLVAGVGNIFLGDDGFGVEVARQLAGETGPAGVAVADFGIRGVHLAYQLLEGYDALILIDATARGARRAPCKCSSRTSTSNVARAGRGARHGPGGGARHGEKPRRPLGACTSSAASPPRLSNASV